MSTGGVWHGQHPRLTKPERAERWWLAIAVTIWWLVVSGVEVEADQRREPRGVVRAPAAAPVVRRHRLFALGRAEWWAACLSGRPLRHGNRVPEPWPEAWHEVATLSEQEFCSLELYP